MGRSANRVARHGALLLLAALSVAPSARADEASSSASSRSERWYGYQTLIADGGALLILTPGVLGADHGFVYAGLGSYAIVPPIIHLAHRQIGKAFLDLGIRVTLPLAGAVVGVLAGWSNGGSQHVNDFVTGKSSNLDLFGVTEAGAIGFLTGMGIAIAVDGALTAREDVDRPALGVVPHPGTTTSSVSVYPTFGPIRSGGSAGVRGTF